MASIDEAKLKNEEATSATHNNEKKPNVSTEELGATVSECQLPSISFSNMTNLISGPMSDELIAYIAPELLPVRDFKLIACEVLALTEEQVNEECCTTSMLKDPLSACLSLGMERQNIHTVQQLKKLVERACRADVIPADALRHLEMLTRSTTQDLSKELTRFIAPHKMEALFCGYFGLTVQEVEQQQPRDLNHKTVCIRTLSLWRKLNPGCNSAEHLLKSLEQAAQSTGKDTNGAFLGAEKPLEKPLEESTTKVSLIYADVLAAVKQKLEDFSECQSMIQGTSALSEPIQTTGLFELQHMLQTYYKKHHKYMSPVCWSDIDDAWLEMDRFFIKLTTSLYDSRASRGASESIALQDLLVQKTPEGSLAEGVLIEGEAGGGKSTLCDKLAWDWSWGRAAIKRLTFFTLVFTVRVSDLNAKETIAEYIKRVLCPGDALNVQDIEHCILQEKERVLIIIDGLDERSREVPGVNIIISGREFPCCTVIVTSRYGGAGRLKRNFDVFLEINKLNVDDMVEFLENYSETTAALGIMNQKPTISALFTTPLLLTLFCIILPKEPDEQMEVTQTSLLDILSNGLKDKIIAKYRYDVEHCNAAFLHMCQTAYGSIVIGTGNIVGKLTTVQEKLGFVKVTGSRGLSDKTYSFTHKLLQEYLAANYIVNENSIRAVDSIIRLVMQIPEVRNEDTRQASTVVMFVCGLMAKYKGDVRHFISVVLPPIVHDSSDDPHCFVGHSRHLSLRCINEVKHMIADTPDILNIDRVYPQKIMLSLSTCDHGCLQGANILAAANSNVDVSTDMKRTILTEATASTMRDVVSLAANNDLSVDGDEQLQTLFGSGGVFVGVPLRLIVLFKCTSSEINRYNVSPPHHGLQISMCGGHEVVGICKQLVSRTLKRLCLSQKITLTVEEWTGVVDLMKDWKGEGFELCDVTVTGSLSATQSTIQITYMYIVECNIQICKALLTMSAECVKKILMRDIKPHSAESEASLPALTRPFNVDLIEISSCSSAVCIDLLLGCKGHITELNLWDISASASDSGMITPVEDLSIDALRITRSAFTVCTTVMQACSCNLKMVLIDDVDGSINDITTLLAVLENISTVQVFSAYRLGEVQVPFLSALAKTRKLHTLATLGVGVCCEEDVREATHLLCVAKQLVGFNSYYRGTTISVERSLCRMVCTAGSNIQQMCLCGVQPDSMVTELEKCSKAERREIKWNFLGLYDLNNNLLTGDWEQKVLDLLKDCSD